MTLLLGIVAFLAVLFTFYGGIIIGIHECKKQFNIPKGATGVDENGYIYS